MNLRVDITVDRTMGFQEDMKGRRKKKKERREGESERHFLNSCAPSSLAKAQQKTWGNIAATL